MNPYQQEHEERKQRILSFLGDVADHMEHIRTAAETDEEGKQAAAKHIEALGNLQGHVTHDVFSIVLIGQFSVGKSTFLNALMGQRILPSWKKETTATVNFLQAKERAPHGEAGIVTYRDGHTEALDHLDYETLERYVSTRGDQGKQTIARTVERVDLFLDNKFLQDGVMLVDSPGLNGIAEDLADITEKQIAESHASIFMFKAGQPGSKTDFTVLRNLREKCNRIFIVLNQIDCVRTGVDENETVEDLVQDIIEKYQRFFPGEGLPEIYPVSAQDALRARDPEHYGDSAAEDTEKLEAASRFRPFEERLWKFLTQGERTKEQLLAPVTNVCKLLEREKRHADDKITMLANMRSPQEFLEKKEKLEDAIAELEKQEREATGPVESDIRDAMEQLKHQMADRFDQFVRRIKLEADEKETAEELSAFASTLQERLRKRCLSLWTEFHEDLQEKMRETVEIYCQDQLQQAVEAMNGIPDLPLKMEVPDIHIDVADVSKDFEERHADFERREKELDALRDQVDKADVDALRARQAEIEAKQRREELRNLQQAKLTFESTFVPAAIVRRQEEETYLRDRTGLAGSIAQIILGKKRDTRLVTVTDSSNHDRDVARLEKATKSYEEEIRQAKTQMAAASKIASNHAADSLRGEQLRRKLESEQEKLTQEEKAYFEKLQRETEKACKQMRRDITEYAERTANVLLRVVKRQLDEQKRPYEMMVRQMAVMTIQKQLEAQRNRWQSLCDAAAADDQARDEKLAFEKAMAEERDRLLQDGRMLADDMDAAMNDVIGEEG